MGVVWAERGSVVTLNVLTLRLDVEADEDVNAGRVYVVELQLLEGVVIMVGGNAGPSRVRMTLLKVASGGSVKGVVLSDAVASLRVHWIGRRSYICPGVECPCCLIAESRWVGFLVVRVAVRGGDRLFLLELTSGAFDRFVGLCKLEGWDSFYGVMFQALRERTKGPLIVEPVEMLMSTGGSPIVLRGVYDALATIYGLPGFREGEEVASWEERASAAAGRAIRLAMEREGVTS